MSSNNAIITIYKDSFRPRESCGEFPVGVIPVSLYAGGAQPQMHSFSLEFLRFLANQKQARFYVLTGLGRIKLLRSSN